MDRPIAHAARIDVGGLSLTGMGRHPAWTFAPPVVWDTDFSGRPTGIVTSARFLYSTSALYVLWELASAGLHADASRFTHVPRPKLYEEDCVELFLAPDPAVPERYFEMEQGPYGHFWDLDVHHARGTKDTTWSSGPHILTSRDTAARRVVIESALTGADIARAMVPGAALPMGLFRMEGAAPRHYLAWSPARTRAPNFHVPDAFGRLILDP